MIEATDSADCMNYFMWLIAGEELVPKKDLSLVQYCVVMVKTQTFIDYKAFPN